MRGNFVNIPIIRINIETGEIVCFSTQQDATKSGDFNTSKIGECCKLKSYKKSHKEYFWIYKKDFYENIYFDLIKALKEPHRKSKKVINKVCSKCKIKKDLNKFHSSSDGLGKRRADCRLCRNLYIKNHKKNNHLVRLKCNLRKRLNAAIHSKKWHKTSKLVNYIGCSQDNLLKHIENQFKTEMSWKNYNHKIWHIDHIIPLSSAKTEEELYKLCHYTNLQPLWAKENLKKGGSYQTSRIS